MEHGLLVDLDIFIWCCWCQHNYCPNVRLAFCLFGQVTRSLISTSLPPLYTPVAR